MRKWTVLAQSTIIKSISSQTLLSFNMQNIDSLFSGFTSGDFAVVHGPSIDLAFVVASCCEGSTSISAGRPWIKRCVHWWQQYIQTLQGVAHGPVASSPTKTGIDANLHFKGVYSAPDDLIILEKLEETIAKHHAKLVIISDFAGLYLDKDIPPEESKEVFSQVTTCLSKLAEENRTIILATCPPHRYSRRNAFFHAMTCARSNITISPSPNRAGLQARDRRIPRRRKNLRKTQRLHNRLVTSSERDPRRLLT